MTEPVNSADVYAAMLDDEESEIDTKKELKPISAPFGAKPSVPLVHDNKSYMVATYQYVLELERIVKRQQTEIKKLERAITNISQSLSSIRNAADRQLQDVRRNLDNKIDRRD